MNLIMDDKILDQISSSLCIIVYTLFLARTRESMSLLELCVCLLRNKNRKMSGGGAHAQCIGRTRNLSGARAQKPQNSKRLGWPGRPPSRQPASQARAHSSLVAVPIVMH
ncbi:unnamed protein product [Musa banksii]